MEVETLLNSHIEWTVILNYITQENNKVLEDKSNETFKFHRLGRIMEEAVSKFRSVVEFYQQHGEPQQRLPLAEN